MITSAIALFDWIIIGLGVYFFCLSVINALWLVKESRPADLTDEPFVSVLIPARDEEAHIEQCIQSFMHQTYTNYEVLVLDDNSTDKTAEILGRLQALYPDKLKVFQGLPLPPDWRGKPFAMKQLCKQAKENAGCLLTRILFILLVPYHLPLLISFIIRLIFYPAILHKK